MKILVLLSLIIFLLCFVYSNGYAQGNGGANSNVSINITEVALLSLKSASSNNITISAQMPNEAGLALDFSKNNNANIWINYSSIIGKSTNSRRTVNAAITGDMPEGVKLKLNASPDVGRGGGHVGLPTGTIVLSNSQQNIISEIGSCYTGVGINNGHLLTYYLELDENTSYSTLENKSVTLTVTFTLNDGS